MRERLPLPSKIAKAPTLHIGLELYYDAFWELSTCRATGWSIGPIPWSAVNDYATTFGFDSEQRDALHHHIRVMDNAYISHFTPKEGKGGKKWRSQPASEGSGSAWSSSARAS